MDSFFQDYLRHTFSDFGNNDDHIHFLTIRDYEEKSVNMILL